MGKNSFPMISKKSSQNLLVGLHFDICSELDPRDGAVLCRPEGIERDI